VPYANALGSPKVSLALTAEELRSVCLKTGAVGEKVVGDPNLARLVLKLDEVWNAHGAFTKLGGRGRWSLESTQRAASVAAFDFDKYNASVVAMGVPPGAPFLGKMSNLQREALAGQPGAVASRRVVQWFCCVVAQLYPGGCFCYWCLQPVAAAAMQLDHMGFKDFTIRCTTKLSLGRLPLIRAEMLKCVIACAHCNNNKEDTKTLAERGGNVGQHWSGRSKSMNLLD
jgi:hypothetical protein